MSLEHMIWAEKYRPRTIDECILPERIKKAAKDIVASGTLPSLLFTGSAGVGKTTLARAIANELDADFMVINASKERGIDVVRSRLEQFASTVSFTDSKKITLMDEADGMTSEAQSAIRGFVEEFSKNHSIIFTANYPMKLIEPIRSRSSPIDFKITKAEKTDLAMQFVKRVFHILDTEKVAYDKQPVVEVVMKTFPDFRQTLMTLELYAKGGKIDAGILLSLSDEKFNALVGFMKAKKFNEVRKWVAENNDIDSVQMFRMFYDKASAVMEPKSIPELILCLGDFSYRDAFVADREVNRMAFLTTLLLSDNIIWK